jgi:hypothetical protein
MPHTELPKDIGGVYVISLYQEIITTQKHTHTK